jgi:glycine cleavage system aminomethyltransferase T
VRRNVALAKLPASLEERAELEVDVLGELVPATVSADALYDPEGRKLL